MFIGVYLKHGDRDDPHLDWRLETDEELDVVNGFLPGRVAYVEKDGLASFVLGSERHLRGSRATLIHYFPQSKKTGRRQKQLSRVSLLNGELFARRAAMMPVKEDGTRGWSMRMGWEKTPVGLTMYFPGFLEYCQRGGVQDLFGLNAVPTPTFEDGTTVEGRAALAEIAKVLPPQPVLPADPDDPTPLPSLDRRLRDRLLRLMSIHYNFKRGDVDLPRAADLLQNLAPALMMLEWELTKYVPDDLRALRREVLKEGYTE